MLRYLAAVLRGAALEDASDPTPAIQTAIQLQTKELAGAMHRLFTQNRVNTQAVGSWEEVRQRLQIEDHDLRQEFKAAAEDYDHDDDDDDDDDFIDSDSEFPYVPTTSIFSTAPMFDEYGELTAAYEDYLERAVTEFRQSPEWGQTTENGLVVRELLQYGAEYEGLLVDEMTVGTVHDYLFRHLPKTNVVKRTATPAILAEMQRFWEFIDRKYQLPDARPIREWLHKSRRAAELDKALGRLEADFDFERFVITEAKRLGYDLTSPEDLHQFTQALKGGTQNVDRQPTDSAVEPQEEFDQPVTYVSDQPKVGRNEPCPCGSGKKFKKCCQRQESSSESR